MKTPRAHLKTYLISCLTSCLALSVSACDDTENTTPLSGGSEAGAPVNVGGAPEAGEVAGEVAGELAGSPEAGVMGAIEAGAEPDLCAEACGALMACVEMSCEAAGDQAALLVLCEERCEGFASFADIALGIDTCDDALAFGRQQLGAPFEEACPEGAPPEVQPVAECEPFAARLSECITERCEPFGAIESEATPLLSSICAQQIANGEVPLTTFASVTSDSSCDNQVIQAYANFLTEVTPGAADSGPLAPICEGGLLNDYTVCEEACAHLAPCIPEGSDGEALRDEGVCRYVCATSPDVASEVWSCLQDAPLCIATGRCFQ